MVAKHLRVSKSCVWSLGLWAVGYGEAVAAKDKNGKWRRKRIETIMSRRSLKKMTNRVVFRINAINVRDRQLVKDILVNTRGPNMWIYRWYIWGFPLFPPRLYCVCNEYFLLCRHFNCCQDYIWHIIWIILCFIQMTSYVSCCFTLNANWKIHSFFTLKETSNWKKIQRFFQAFSLAKQ